MKRITTVLALTIASSAFAAEYHVAVIGDDTSPGSPTKPLLTISAAAALAQPGDTITVHEGVYRERIDPPRGGTSDAKRITYQSAPGEEVVITGSEPVKGWAKVSGDTWKVSLPNKFFGAYNPYRELIGGDWFNGRGRQHHTGAVYLDGRWLIEAAKSADVMKPAAGQPLWCTDHAGSSAVDTYLVNIAWLKAGAGAKRPAVPASAKRGTQPADCSEGGQCLGFIRAGDWLRYDEVDFGAKADRVELRVASQEEASEIELRLDNAQGELLGTAPVKATGDWQKWTSVPVTIKPTSGKKNLCLVFKSPRADTATDPESTTIWAQFPGVNPNKSDVEINVRPTVFSPTKTGINYITVRGFTLRNAATNWAPPSAGQIGLVSAYWCKGWIIENNDISYSKCSGIALGKYGDEFDNTNKAGAADPYTDCVRRALKNGWNKETVGSHLVRNNHISHCEQTGVVGSLGCSFSTITGNEIHDIHVHRLFSGAEMAGIKFHAAVDVRISGNHIYRTCGGIWLDWMTQGTQVIGDLLHDNSGYDLFCEVDHGPFLIANNIMLSPQAHALSAQGGAYAHNLIAGTINVHGFDGRMTPVLKPHDTAFASLHNNPTGDVRHYNNILSGAASLAGYDNPMLPVSMAGNVFLNGAKPCKTEAAPLLKPDFNPQLKLVEKTNGWYLDIVLDPAWATAQTRQAVTTERLGKATIPNQQFTNPDGSPVRIDTDYLGHKRNAANPFPGPFEAAPSGTQSIKVWPLTRR